MTNETETRWLIALGFQSDPGRARERNEDAYAVYVPYAGEDRVAEVDGLFAVADGMGGHDAGDQASRHAAKEVLRAVVSPGSDGAALEATFQRISRELREMAIASGASQGMGSTLTVAVLRAGTLDLAHVGDTRLYRMREGALEQLTPDHSWVAEQLRAGLLTPEEAEAHPRRNLLTQCLGIGRDLKVHVAQHHVQDGDRYLICCDGLHGQVPDEVIGRVLREEPEPQPAVRRLVAMANDTGGPDNITAVLFDLHRAAPAAATMPDQPALAVTGEQVVAEAEPVPVATPKRRWAGSLPLMAAGAALVLGAAGWSAFAVFRADEEESGATPAVTDTAAPVRTEEAAGPAPGPVDPRAVQDADTARSQTADSTGGAAAGGASLQRNPDRQEPRS